MITTLSRLFKVAFLPRQPNIPAPSLKNLGTIRRALLLAIEDCASLPAERLKLKIEQTKTPQELWLLRNDAYQIISQRHDQGTAARRINDLIPVFAGSLDPKQLVEIK